VCLYFHVFQIRPPRSLAPLFYMFFEIPVSPIFFGLFSVTQTLIHSDPPPLIISPYLFPSGPTSYSSILEFPYFDYTTLTFFYLRSSSRTIFSLNLRWEPLTLFPVESGLGMTVDGVRPSCMRPLSITRWVFHYRSCFSYYRDFRFSFPRC